MSKEFDIAGFMSDVAKETEPDDKLEDLLSEFDTEEEKNKARKCYYNLLRVMKAEKIQDLDDIPNEDVFLLFDYASFFINAFVGEIKAYQYLNEIVKNAKEVKSSLQRRVL